MTKDRIPLLLLLLMITSILTSCAKNKTTASAVVLSPDLSEMIKKQIGDYDELNYSLDKTYLAIASYRSNKKNDAFPTLNLSIVNLATNKVVHRINEKGGRYKWKNDYQIQINGEGGIPNPETGDSGVIDYYYDLKLKKKITGGFLKKLKNSRT